MDDGIKKLFSLRPQSTEQKNHRHLQTDGRSVGSDLQRSVTRPRTSLKAKMLGGHAEKISRLGGSMR